MHFLFTYLGFIMNLNTYNKEFWYINTTPAFLDSATELVENVWYASGTRCTNGFRREVKRTQTPEQEVLYETVRTLHLLEIERLETEKLERELIAELQERQNRQEELRMQQELDAYNNSWLGKFINFVGSRTYWLLVAGSAIIITIINY